MDSKSANQAYIYPVEGDITGKIPHWIEGSLYRIGAAMYHVGADKYNHLFDGLGMIQRYWLHDGRVTFNSQYIQSDTYMKNMIANRIVVSEFGTAALPDPCQSIFNKFSTIFESGMTDNTNVCVYPIGDELFSATETNVIHRINQQDLSTIGSVRLDKLVAVHRATAHQHIDIGTGLVHLLGFVNSPPGYALVTLPPIKKEKSTDLKSKYDMETLLTSARISGKVDVRWKFNPSYFHSFGITENYYILLECPLTISILDIMKSKVLGSSFANTLKWWPQEKTLIHIISKETGCAIQNKYITDALFTFHHINAYEEDGHVVVDYCGYDDGSLITGLIKDIDKLSKGACARRLVVPLKVDLQTEENENLITISGTTATAKIISKDKTSATVYCSQEDLSTNIFLELPTINYNVYNGRKYRYIYGVDQNMLTKIDAVTKQTLTWRSEVENSVLNESVFLRDPSADDNNPDDEDLGVLLAPVIYHTKEEIDRIRYQSLVIIDAKSMCEIARAEFKSVSIPLTFHGVFLNDN